MGVFVEGEKLDSGAPLSHGFGGDGMVGLLLNGSSTLP